MTRSVDDVGTRGSRRTAYLAWATICLIWGTTYVAIKIALETIPPFVMGGLRYGSAGALLAAIAIAARQPLPERAAWRHHLISGTLLLGLGNGGVILAEQWVASGLAAVVVAATPFWMVGIEALLPSGDRLTRRAVAGLLIGFSGIVLLVWPDLGSGATGRAVWSGLAALQVASIGWAFGSAYSRRHASAGHALGGAAMQMLFGGLVMLTAGTLLGEWTRLTFTTDTALALVYLSIAGSLVGFAAYIYALTHLPTAFVSLYAYVNPIVAVVLGWLVLGEPLGWRLAAAVAIILGAMAIVSRRPSPAREAQATSSRDAERSPRPATSEPGAGRVAFASRASGRPYR
jgi:drug/metabolite transporter (DMT)-like permease